MLVSTKSPLAATLKRFIKPLLCASLLLGGQAVGWAQEENPQISALSQLCWQNSFDQAITQASVWIEAADDKAESLDPALYYWRGWAEFKIGGFAGAKDDMQKALAGGVQFRRNSPDEVLARIASIQALLPPKQEEVKIDGVTRFQVCANAQDEVTRAVLEALPKAYRTDFAMYGTEISDQLVVVFDSQAQVDAYEKACGITAPTGAAGFYDGSTLVVCKWVYAKDLTEDPATGIAMRSSVTGLLTHEYNHCLLLRQMGGVRMPMWFVEGIAEYARAQVMPLNKKRNESQMAQLVKEGAIAPPRMLEDRDSFNAATVRGVALQQQGQTKEAYAPYAQSYSMLRFMLDHLEKGKLAEFLQEVEEQRSFWRGFQSSFAMDLPRFYELWADGLAGK